MDSESLIERELQGSLEFFLQFTNLSPDSPGFGLTADSTKKPGVASIAAVGFALTAWVIAAERGFLPKAQARDIVRGTLRTLCDTAAHHRGFFAHFLHMQSGARFGKCEYSTIDTALCLNGVITAAAYFGEDGEIAERAQQLLEQVDWEFIVFEQGGKTLFRMAYNPDEGGDYVQGTPGFISQWDMAAEQKMMYLQAAPRLDPAVAVSLYRGFSRDIGYYEGQPIIINPGGTLFAYQYTEAWLDTARYLDPDGVDWFANTRWAALANRSFCIAHAHEHPAYHSRSWGLSAGDSPWGYDVSGSTPCLRGPHHNGTVCISAAIACLPFLPQETMEMMGYLYEHHPKTWGPYGFFDSYNLSVDPPWYSTSIYAINKGCSMIMLENHRSGLVWRTYTNSAPIQKALSILGFQERAGGYR